MDNKQGSSGDETQNDLHGVGPFGVRVGGVRCRAGVVGRLTLLRKFTLHFAATAPRGHSLLRERKLERLLGLLHALVPKGVENSPQRAESGEVNVVSHDQLFAITSRVAGVQELVVSTQKSHRRAGGLVDRTAALRIGLVLSHCVCVARVFSSPWPPSG